MKDNVKNLIDINEADARDNEIASLSEDLEKERDERKEERFVWIIALMILADLFMFQGMQTWGGPIAILVLQVIAIASLAHRLGNQEIVGIINKIVANVRRQ